MYSIMKLYLSMMLKFDKVKNDVNGEKGWSILELGLKNFKFLNFEWSRFNNLGIFSV